MIGRRRRPRIPDRWACHDCGRQFGPIDHARLGYLVDRHLEEHRR